MRSGLYIYPKNHENSKGFIFTVWRLAFRFRISKVTGDWHITWRLYDNAGRYTTVRWR